jgi:hypothetical protein
MSALSPADLSRVVGLLESTRCVPVWGPDSVSVVLALPADARFTVDFALGVPRDDDRMPGSVPASMLASTIAAGAEDRAPGEVSVAVCVYVRACACA